MNPSVAALITSLLQQRMAPQATPVLVPGGGSGGNEPTVEYGTVRPTWDPSLFTGAWTGDLGTALRLNRQVNNPKSSNLSPWRLMGRVQGQ